MTLEETGIIMDILTTAYPHFYGGPNAPDMVKALKLWAEMFARDDVALVAAAVKATIESDDKGHPPHIGAVKAKLRLISGGDEMTEAEAWGIVSRALRNSTYGSKEEFEKFPPVIKRLVGSPNQLREWSAMDSETVHSVVASNFQRSYKAIAQREREIAKLPPDIKALVGKIADGKRLDALPEKKPELPQKPEDKPVPAPREKLAAAISPGTGRSLEEVLVALRGGQLQTHNEAPRRTVGGAADCGLSDREKVKGSRSGPMW